MKPLFRWTAIAAAAVLVAAAGTAWWTKRQASAEPAHAAAEPIAQVTTELARSRLLSATIESLGDVSAGQLVGLSFQRAGQVTRLGVLPGDRVAKGATLATFALDPAARETYLQAGNALAVARREAERLHQLLGLQLATQSQADAADKAVLDAAGTVKALDAQGGASTGSTMTAPFDGVVAGVSIAQGDRVAPGATVLQLARSDALRVQIGIDPADRLRVKPGMAASLTPLSTMADKPRPIEARVATVQDVVDPKSRLVSVIVNLSREASPQLVPGMKVRASIEVGAVTAVAVPRDAVLSDSQGDYVYQIAGGKARRVAVEKRLESGGFVAIAGLGHLELPVVTLGNYELQDGMAVKESAR